MGQRNTFSFVTDSVRGRQKIKRYAKRQLNKLPAHKRLTPFDKLMRKNALKRRFERENNDDKQRS